MANVTPVVASLALALLLVGCTEPVRSAASGGEPPGLSASRATASAPVRAASASAAVGAVALPPGACRVRSDCHDGKLCVYQRPGCDAPAGTCLPPPESACAVALPVATCSGESYRACLHGPSELPYYSRYDGTPGFAFEPGHDPESLRGGVAEVAVYHAPDEINADVSMTAERLERTNSAERRASKTPKTIGAAIDLLTNIVAARGATRADLRWEIVLLDQRGQRIASVGIDKFGDHGEINRVPVTFAHGGALAAVRALAATMPTGR